MLNAKGHWEEQYLDLMSAALQHGDPRMDRTGDGTHAIFAETIKFDLNDGFPAPFTKTLAWKAVVSELLWFLEGSSDERRLCEIYHGSRDAHLQTIWTGNAEAPYWKQKAQYNGDLGRVYGVQWRSWRKPDGSCVDQVSDLIHKLKTNPTDRRMMIVGYNVGELDDMALPPCHYAYQVFVENGTLHAKFDQRSVDIFLGLPFNLASYALLTHMLAQIAGLKVGTMTANLGDCHVYKTHVDQAVEQLRRPTDWTSTPVLQMPRFTTLDELLATKPSDYVLHNYHPQGPIKAKMSV